jgi:hypothetical protein
MTSFIYEGVKLESITTQQLISAKLGLIALTQYYNEEIKNKSLKGSSSLDTLAIESLYCEGVTISYKKLRRVIRCFDLLTSITNKVCRGYSIDNNDFDVFDKDTILFLENYYCQPQKLQIEYIELSLFENRLREMRLVFWNWF